MKFSNQPFCSDDLMISSECKKSRWWTKLFGFIQTLFSIPTKNAILTILALAIELPGGMPPQYFFSPPAYYYYFRSSFSSSWDVKIIMGCVPVLVCTTAAEIFLETLVISCTTRKYLHFSIHLSSHRCWNTLPPHPFSHHFSSFFSKCAYAFWSRTSLLG